MGGTSTLYRYEFDDIDEPEAVAHLTEQKRVSRAKKAVSDVYSVLVKSRLVKSRF